VLALIGHRQLIYGRWLKLTYEQSPIENNGIKAMWAGVDWITMTVSSEVSDYAEWRNKCLIQIERRANSGNAYQTTSRLGYIGHSAGGWFCGERYQDSIFIATGSEAGKAYEATYHQQAHCSRLDAQVTLQLERDDQRFGVSRYSEAIIANNRLPSARRRKLRQLSEWEGGSTYYIGSRRSSTMGRIYDKMRESKDERYANCWRYEVELHNREATEAYHYLAVTDVPQPAVAENYVARWFLKRGIACPFWLDGVPDPLWPMEEKHSDATRKLEWLNRQVRPALRRLREIADDATIAEALGIAPGSIVWHTEESEA